MSGTAVAIGFLGLLLVPLWELRSLGVGGLLVVGASVLLATTLLPALLAWLGPRVDAGQKRRRFLSHLEHSRIQIHARDSACVANTPSRMTCPIVSASRRPLPASAGEMWNPSWS